MKIYEWIKAISQFLLFTIIPLRKAKGVFGMNAIISLILVASGVLSTPMAIKFQLISVPENTPSWIYFFGIPAIVLFVLAVIAGTRLQYLINSKQNTNSKALEKSDALDKLASLREDVSSLWYKGLELTNINDCNNWIKECKDLQQSIIKQMELISTAEAKIFGTLHSFPSSSLLPKKPINDEQVMWINMLNHHTELIKDFIRRFSNKFDFIS